MRLNTKLPPSNTAFSSFAFLVNLTTAFQEPMISVTVADRPER